VTRSWRWIALAVLVGFAVPASAADTPVHRKLKVAAINDDWTRTGIFLDPGQLVVIIAEGTVKLRSYRDGEGESVGPQGLDNGSGRLEGKIGGAMPFVVGTSIAFYAKEPGMLKLRMKDKRYDDNIGGFDVKVLVMKPSQIPPATDVPAESQ
jgi:hypothetical protein